jgi:hypothetical protein
MGNRACFAHLSSVEAWTSARRCPYDRIWLLPDTGYLWDQEGVVRRGLDRQCELVLERQWRGVPLLLYHTPSHVLQELHSLDAKFDKAIRLQGYTLRDSEGGSVEYLEVDAGQRVRLTLCWLAEESIDEDYTVFVHLVDATGWLRGQQDNQPHQGSFPTRAWTPGELVIDTYSIPIGADGPRGGYLVEVGLYHSGDGTRLPVWGGDADPAQRRVLLRDLVHVR